MRQHVPDGSEPDAIEAFAELRTNARDVTEVEALKELSFEAGPLAMIFAVGGVSSLVGAIVVRPVTRALGVGVAMIAGLLVTVK